MWWQWDFKFDMIFFYFVDYIFIFYDQIVAYIVVAVNSYEMKKKMSDIFLKHLKL